MKILQKISLVLLLIAASNLYAGGCLDDVADANVCLLIANQGDAKAQFALGWAYYNGEGVPQDYKEALKWWRKAAEQGDADAQYSLGWAYYNGEGVPQDYKEALKWWRKAAEQGNAKAQNNLGLMYGKGQGVLQDYVTAHMYFNIAAANGNKSAAENRGIVERKMSVSQIAEAQGLAREWVRKHNQ